MQNRRMLHGSESTPVQQGAYRFYRSDWLLLIMAAAGLLGATLLGNPAASRRVWPEGSILEQIVWVLSLGYRLPTSRGLEAKSLAVAAVSGLLLIGATVRMVRRRVQVLDYWQGFRGSTNHRVGAATLSAWAALLLIVWGLASASWSGAAAISIGSAWVFSLGYIWAAGLALHGHRLMVRHLADVLLGCAAVTAVLSLWYWNVRGTDARLGWPMGNPLLLASVMVPAIVIGAGRLAERFEAIYLRGLARRLLIESLANLIGVCLVVAALWATHSRGPLLAMLVGLAGAGWIALSRRSRVAWGLIGVVVVAMAVPTVAEKIFDAGGGRDASARMRLYAWSDAIHLAMQKPAAGQGAGGYSRLATSLSARDTVADPLAMGGEVSSHAHCEMLEVAADLGVFGLIVGLAIWGLAFTAATARVRSEDRWIAAAVAGAIVAVLLDACTGVSWRMAGPVAYMAMVLALAWMLWRPARPAEITQPHRHFTWHGVIPAVLGIGVATAGTIDFAAARFLYRGQQAAAAAATLRQRGGAMTEAHDLATYSVEQADAARYWRLDPPRRLEAWMVSGRFHELPAIVAPASASKEPADLAKRQGVLDEGVTILTEMSSVAPDYGDLQWRIAELLNGKAHLAQLAGQDVEVRQYRGQSLNAALQYFQTNPLDAERIWRAPAIWPEIEAAQRLQLLRGTLREEAQVWRPVPTFTATAWQRWSQERGDLNRLWYALGEKGMDVAQQFLETGYSHLPLAYRGWSDLLAPEGVRLAAHREVLAGNAFAAADALGLADLLYQHSSGLLAYSLAMNGVELAAARVRQGAGSVARARADLVAAQSQLKALPDNWVRGQIEEIADDLAAAIEVVAGEYNGGDGKAWAHAVDLFWDMAPRSWPDAIEGWAKRADATTGSESGRFILLQLYIARGDVEAAQRRAAELLGQGVAAKDVDSAVRYAGYRWPWRQEMLRSGVG